MPEKGEKNNVERIFSEFALSIAGHICIPIGQRQFAKVREMRNSAQCYEINFITARIFSAFFIQIAQIEASIKAQQNSFPF